MDLMTYQTGTGCIQQPSKPTLHLCVNGSVAGFPKITDLVVRSTKIGALWTPACWLFWEPDAAAPFRGRKPAPPWRSIMTAQISRARLCPLLRAAEGIGKLHDKAGGNVGRIDGGSMFVTSNKFNLESKGPPGTAPDGYRTLLWWSTYYYNGHQAP